MATQALERKERFRVSGLSEPIYSGRMRTIGLRAKGLGFWLRGWPKSLAKVCQAQAVHKLKVLITPIMSLLLYPT